METKKFNEFVSEAYHIITHDKTDIWISDKAYKRLKKGKDVVGYTEDKYEGGHKDVWVFKDDIDVIVKSKEGLADVVDMYAKFESNHNMKHVNDFKTFLVEKYTWETSGDKDDIKQLTSMSDQLKKMYSSVAPKKYNMDDFEDDLDKLLTKHTKDVEEYFDSKDANDYGASRKMHRDFMEASQKMFKTTTTNPAWKGIVNRFTTTLSNIFQITMEAKAGRTSNRGYKVMQRPDYMANIKKYMH